MLHVAVVPQQSNILNETVSLSEEIAQCKAALLYADSVTLYSQSLMWLKSLLGSAIHFDMLAKATRDPPPDRQDDILLSLRNPEYWELLSEHFHRVYRERWEYSGIDELIPAIKAGVLIQHRILEDDEHWLDGRLLHHRLIERVADLFSEGSAFPLLDAQMYASLLEDLRRYGYFGRPPPAPSVARRLADSSIAAELIGRLPNFPSATVAEILDVRRALARPLGRFRAGVMEMSKTIDIAPEDPDFMRQVEELQIRQVQPALEEIEEIIREDSSFRGLMGRAVRDPGGLLAGGGGSGIALALGTQPRLIAALAVVITGSTSTARARYEQRKARQGAERSQFYFLYGADRSLRR